MEVSILTVVFTLISLTIGFAGVLLTYIKMSKDKVKDVSDASAKNASESAVFNTKLDSINLGIQTVSMDVRGVQQTMNHFNERLTRVEESTKHAHKRIDDSVENKYDKGGL